MRVYGKLINCKHLVSIDCVTIQNSDNDQVLNLSFSEQDFDHKGFTESFRLKDEDLVVFESNVDFEVGNNEDTYKFIREGYLSSVVLYQQDIDSYTEIKPKLKYLVIEVGNRQLFLKTKNTSIEVYTE